MIAFCGFKHKKNKKKVKDWTEFGRLNLMCGILSSNIEKLFVKLQRTGGLLDCLFSMSGYLVFYFFVRTLILVVFLSYFMFWKNMLTVCFTVYIYKLN